MQIFAEFINRRLVQQRRQKEYIYIGGFRSWNLFDYMRIKLQTTIYINIQRYPLAFSYIMSCIAVRINTSSRLDVHTYRLLRLFSIQYRFVWIYMIKVRHKRSCIYFIPTKGSTFRLCFDGLAVSLISRLPQHFIIKSKTHLINVCFLVVRYKLFYFCSILVLEVFNIFYNKPFSMYYQKGVYKFFGYMSVCSRGHWTRWQIMWQVERTH